MNFKGNAVITGGIGGIGLAIAQHLLRNGIQVKEKNLKFIHKIRGKQSIKKIFTNIFSIK